MLVTCLVYHVVCNCSHRVKYPARRVERRSRRRRTEEEGSSSAVLSPPRSGVFRANPASLSTGRGGVDPILLYVEYYGINCIY